MIDDTITLGNFIGPAVAALTAYGAYYWQSKSARRTDMAEALRPTIEQLHEIKTRTENFVPKAEIETQFRSVGAHLLIHDMDIKEVREETIKLRISQGKSEQALVTVTDTIDEIKDQQKEILKRLDSVLTAVRQTQS